MTNVHPEKS